MAQLLADMEATGITGGTGGTEAAAADRQDPGPFPRHARDLALRLAPVEYAARERLRMVAAELVRRGLEVRAVDYESGCAGA